MNSGYTLSSDDSRTVLGTETDAKSGIEEEVYHGDVTERYDEWPSPTVIVSDGAYGTGSFPGDPPSTADLVEWYEPHVEAWSDAATLQTTLWVWNTEIGWATIHPLLEKTGWTYRGCNTWNKGLSHIAGNSNTDTMRKFPQVTEVCVQYVRQELQLNEESKHFRNWMREEWQRAGLSFSEANTACGVEDAASRKYFASDEQWYCPPPEVFDTLVKYANEHGDPEGRPYLSLPETATVDRNDISDRSDFRRQPCASFDLPAGVTNVWDLPQLSGEERYEVADETLHLNQKPLTLMERIIRASSHPHDVVWDPFAGTGTVAVAAKRLSRHPFAAEQVKKYHSVARDRLSQTAIDSVESDTEQYTIDSF